MYKVSGDIVDYKFYVSCQDTEYNSRLYYNAKEFHKNLEYSIRKLVKDILGSEFDVTSFKIEKGSIILLMTIGTICSVISKYKNFIESLELIKIQVEQILRNRFKNDTYDISINTSIKNLDSINNMPFKEKTSFLNNRSSSILLNYLIFSHFILILTIIYLLLFR